MSLRLTTQRARKLSQRAVILEKMGECTQIEDREGFQITARNQRALVFGSLSDDGDEGCMYFVRVAPLFLKNLFDITQSLGKINLHRW